MDSFASFVSFKGLCFGYLDSFDSSEAGVLGFWTLLTVLTVSRGGGVFGVDSLYKFEGGALNARSFFYSFHSF